MLAKTLHDLIRQKKTIAAQIAVLQAQLKSVTKAIRVLSKVSPTAAAGVGLKKRTMSAEARRKISIARKKWWAEKKAAEAKATRKERPAQG